MSTTIPKSFSTQGAVALIPDAHEIALAAESRHALQPLSNAIGDQILTVSGAQGTTGEVRIPAVAARLLFAALSQMASGQGISLLALDAELRTQDAADLLNVSRPFLVGLLEKGDIPFRKVGIQRRVLLRDIVNYKMRAGIDQRAALDELASLGQEIGIGYEA